MAETRLQFLHDLADFRDLIDVTARAQSINPGLVEKDYWIMQGLWGLQQLGFQYELKGGTSLSKGFQLIHRFSEDIDILIHPEGALPIGPNHTKPVHIEARRAFFDGLPGKMPIDGFVGAERDHDFDDLKMRGAGIRLRYPTVNPLPEGVKDGILLEAGFDQVAPNRALTISSWAYEQAILSGVTNLIDNRAVGVACYEPGYTLVEKLQTISTKYRSFKARGALPQNFLRHYYDVFCLLSDSSVRAFVGTQAYLAHKKKRFPEADEKDLTRNPAFLLTDADTRRTFETAYLSTRALYYREQPAFALIIERLQSRLSEL